MGKVVSSYSSVVRGVSEQVPQDRHPGQHYEQVNMVSDPVRGMARRHGSRYLAEHQVALPPVALTDPYVQGLVDQMREYSFFMHGKEYSAVYRSGGDPNAVSLAQVPLISIYSKDEGKFLNIVQDNGNAAMNQFKLQGLCAMTTVGDYLVAAGNGLTPAYTQTDPFTSESGRGAAWVRGGAYSRTYTIVAQRADGILVSATYTTKGSSYPNLLDTSTIPWDSPPGSGTPDPSYQSKVNNMVNAYNSAATKWIGDAFADQQPSNIVGNLYSQLVTNGFNGAGSNVGPFGNTIGFINCLSLSTSDGGDGTLFVNVLNEITDASKVTSQHFVGKVVRVRAPGAVDSYYLIAQGSGGLNSFGQVTWVESPAQIVAPTTVFAIGRLSNDGNTFYFAAQPARLDAISGIAGTPGFQSSHAGDLAAIGSKPYFLDHPVTALTVFQDRLTIVSNGVIFMSQSGDYFNWFRSSSLSVADSDPIEVYALGTEDDIITKTVTYNKNLFLFGNRNQYVVSGQNVLTPRTATAQPAAAEHGSNYARPAVSGNLLYYGRSKKNRKASPSPYNGALSQFQLGLFEDSPETYTASSQLDKYMQGRPVEITALVEPTTVFVRTDGNPFGMYVYSFIDNPANQQREFDSWSRWEWDPNIVGRIAGVVTYDSSILVYVFRSDGQGLWIGAEEFVMDSEVSDLPYVDSLRPWTDYNRTGAFNRAQYVGVNPIYVAMDDTSNYYLMGTEIAKSAAFVAAHSTEIAKIWQGSSFDAYADITPPYVRDQNDRAYTTGDLTIGQYVVSVVDTAGMDAERTSENVTSVVKKFNGRILGNTATMVGRQPIATTNIYVPVGKSNVRHRMLFRARSWLPLCISAISWTGQTFFNSRRV